MAIPPGEWVPVATDASARRYFQGTYKGKKSLLADFRADLDGRARFVHVASLFCRHGLYVPEIIECPEGESYLIQEWIEGWPLAKVKWSRRLEDPLLDTASKIGDIESWGEGPEILELDEARMAFELSFFRLHFMEDFLNTPVPAELPQALSALVEQIGTFPLKLAHRDFHSENVIATGDKRLVLVDFQDALMAPRCYDAASLAVDAYRLQDRRIAERFMTGWLERSEATAEEFRMTALQRALKALGTFGYQVTRQKKVRFLKFIRPTATQALSLLDAAPVSLGCLRPVLMQATQI